LPSIKDQHYLDHVERKLEALEKRAVMGDK
jgi:hypothetical protein